MRVVKPILLIKFAFSWRGKKNKKKNTQNACLERDILVPTKPINLPKWISSMEIQSEEEVEEKGGDIFCGQ